MTKEKIAKLKEEVKLLENENIDFYIDMTENLINKQGVEIVFSGTLSNGKSTVLNAILEQNLLQTGIGSTTAKITYISKGIDGAVGVLNNGDEIAKTLDSNNIKELNENNNVKIVKIQKEDFKYSNITFVDSPGINDINKIREDISYAYVPIADIVVFVLDISKGITADEKSFFDDKIIKTHKDKIFILLNGLDKIEGEDLSPVLNNPLLDGYKLFPISAKQYLVGALESDDVKINKSKFKAFLDEFHNYISSIDGYKILNNRIDKSIVSIKELSKLQINSMIKNLSKSKDELEIELNKTNQELKVKEEEVARLRESLENEILDIKSYISESISKMKKQIETNEDTSEIIEYINANIQDIMSYSKNKLNSIEIDMGAIAKILNTLSKHFSVIISVLGTVVTKISLKSAIFSVILNKAPFIESIINKASGFVNSKDKIREILNGVEVHFENELNRLQKEESQKLEYETLSEVKTNIHSLELSLNKHKSEQTSINEDIDKMNKNLENILSCL
jgi:GTP-binding protein EngB required for normal cell division